MSDATDAMDVLRIPIEPVDPDPTFAARLRRELQDALMEPNRPRGGRHMSDQETATTAEEVFAWPPALTPYIMVADARRAIDWYVDVFHAHQRGDVYEMPDGSIGHAEVGIDDSVLMLAEASPSMDVPVAAPAADERTFSHTLHLQVDDVDATVLRAADGGADVERRPTDEPYGRVAVVIDPFGHRWMLNRPPAGATRVIHGDVAYVTLSTRDAERAKAFYGAVLGWQFAPGNVPDGWQIEGRTPMMGLHGDPVNEPGASVCYRVADIEAAIARVREHGGEAADPQRQPYGLLAECTDDQGARFELWQP